jgi:lipoprotein NlpI
VSPSTPDFSNTCYRALIFDDEEEYADYIARMTARLEIDPHDHVAFNNRGVAYTEIGEADIALADFALGCSERPDDCVPYLNLAEALATRGDLSAALEAANAASCIAPTDPSCKIVRANIERAIGRRGLGR